MTPLRKIEILSQKISPARFAKMKRAVEWRTRRLTLVLEDIFQPHNAAAALRSCDAFGVQDIHAIENLYRLQISGDVDMGASKWQDLYFYRCPTASSQKGGMKKPKEFSPMQIQNTRNALEKIRAKGYLLAASSLAADAVGIDEVPVDRPLALMVGTELSGLSPTALEMADITFSLPMLGFAQSFNLSVFAALCLSKFSSAMRARGGEWKLSPDEKNALLARWLERSVTNSQSLLDE